MELTEEGDIMKKTILSAKEKNHKVQQKITYIDILVVVCSTILAVVSIIIGVNPTSTLHFKIAFIAITAIASVILIALLILKIRVFQKSEIIKRQYSRERKINEINHLVFKSLNFANFAKTREILRYTYGTVPEWNPIDYKDNILLYDVHEQIRSILISLKNVVINIDPIRFNDQNVSVELVYCYPQEDRNNGRLPSEEESNQERVWKLISSGDTSGNHSKVLDYLKNPKSFYMLVDYCGIKFANNKFGEMINSTQLNDLFQSINRSGCTVENNGDGRFFISDTKDIEYAPNGNSRGSIVGAVINVRNDNPEETYIKAILTINTYGEQLHIGEAVDYKKNTERSIYDKDGLTQEDYRLLFCDSIIGAYKTLLASELTQMYMRHELRKGRICFLTGRRKEEHDTDCTLQIKQCEECLSSPCNRTKHVKTPG